VGTAQLPDVLRGDREDFERACIFKMTDDLLPTVKSDIQKRARRSAQLLASAGGAVLCGVYIVILIVWASTPSGESPRFRDTWEETTYFPLSMMIVALMLGIIGIWWQGTEEARSATTVKGRGQVWTLFIALAVMHFGMALLACRPGSGNGIDTYTFANDSCKRLLQGINPYASGATHANIYPQHEAEFFYGSELSTDGQVLVGYPYPPLALLWFLPGYLLGNIQYSSVLAVMVSALFLLKLNPNLWGLWTAAVLLLNPLTWFAENRCWTEPLVLMMLSILVYGAIKKHWWLPIVLGLFLATKQYNVLALPLIGFLVQPFQWRAYWKLLGSSLIVASATVLPFALWDFHGLWHDLAVYLLALPPRPDALSFAARFPFLKSVGPVLVLALVIWLMRIGQRTASTFSSAYGLVLLLFFITSKQAFLNYYLLIASALFLAVAALPLGPESTLEMSSKKGGQAKPLLLHDL
jgi:hypothetical protein